MKNKRIDNETFIKKSAQKHNNKYDYSKTKYTRHQDYVTIICPEHGEFQQNAGYHLNGFGCKMCYPQKSREKHKEKFIKKCRTVHSDRYDYSNLEYTNIKTDISLICDIHGEFKINPEMHLKGLGCPSCKIDTYANCIENYKKLYPEYNFDKSVYRTQKTSITVQCNIHGYFSIKPYNMLCGKGCPECNEINERQIKKSKFIEDAIILHGDKYDYSKVDYVSSHSLVKIICPVHGEFEQSPNNHLAGSHGCTQCGTDKKTYTQDEFIKICSEKHDHKYDYSKVKYTKSINTVNIICPDHGEFILKASLHLNGTGCQKCSPNIFGKARYKDKSAIIYYVYFPDYNLYKIGITRNDPYKRFASEIKDGIKIEVLNTKFFEDGEKAYELEQYILSRYNKFQYTGERILYSGNTELFVENVLNFKRNKNENN